MLNNAKESLFGNITVDQRIDHSPRAINPALATMKPYGYNLEIDDSRLYASQPRKGIKNKKHSMMATLTPQRLVDKLADTTKFQIPLNSLHSYVDPKTLEQSR